MPTYSYACTECPNTFDIVQSFTDNTLTICPECKGHLRKLYKNVGVVFKGSGFYRNDSRSTQSSHSDSTSSSAANSNSSNSASSTSTPASNTSNTTTSDSSSSSPST